MVHPGQGCALNPNKGCKVVQTSESLMNAKDRSRGSPLKAKRIVIIQTRSLKLRTTGGLTKYGRRLKLLAPANTWGMNPSNKYKQMKYQMLINTVTSMVHYQNAKGEAKCACRVLFTRVKTETKKS